MSPRQQITLLRKQLRQQFNEEVPIAQLVAEYTQAIDSFLQTHWQQQQLDQCRQLALIACGGYGRQELLPYSDIDLLILSDTSLSSQQQQQVESFIQISWDAGLQVGQQVDTLNQCLKLARDDLTVISTLMESRLITGCQTLFEQLQQNLKTERLWSSEQFFKAKWQEQQQRYQKYEHTAYNLEPNIKQSPGGLRDIHMIGWVAKRHFGAATLHDLVDHKFLTEDEYATLIKGQQHLWRITFALHWLTKRAESRLLFDHQPTIAKMLGYKDQHKQLAVEQFMTDYFCVVKSLRELNDMLLQLFREAIVGKSTTEITPLNERFQICNQYIEVTHDTVFEEQPAALLELFLLMAKHSEIRGVRAQTIRLIRQHKHLIDQNFRDNPQHCQLFIDLLRQSTDISKQLQRMNRYGLLAHYLPAFGKVIGQMQFDLFHIYTVDQHTLFVIRNICRFAQPEFRAQFPLCTHIFERISKPEILYLAALFHDIAKGRGGDHSDLGATEAYSFCEHHGLSKEECELVSWLVKNHLLLSMTAQREDIYDPTIIENFAMKITNLRRLDYLYLLTIADICGTNPSLWNNWRATLLKELYYKTKQLYKVENKLPSKKQLVNEKQMSATNLLSEQAIDLSQASRFWQLLPDTYFLQESPAHIAWHTQEILVHPNPQKPLVLIKQQKNTATEVVIYTRNHTNLFAISTTVLANHHYNILEARLNTIGDTHTLASYMVLGEHSQQISTQDEISQLKQSLIQHHEQNQSIPKLRKRRKPRHLHHFHLKPTIDFTQDHKGHRTIMELTTLDKPGLLARISRALIKHEMLLQHAKVMTMGERVEDRFFITDKKKKCISDEDKLESLRQYVYDILLNHLR